MNVLAYLWEQLLGGASIVLLMFIGAMVLVAIAVIGEAIGKLWRRLKSWVMG